MAELLIGSGNRRDKLIASPGRAGWEKLTTLDIDPNSGADVEWDLNRMPLPFEAESFDEIHAYHVLEHLGTQGDYKFFFAQWSEFYRLLKPDGIFCAVVPGPGSPWAFGDPGHTRYIAPEALTFLDQIEYTKQVGVTPLADYRHVYRADFESQWHRITPVAEDGGQFFFVLKAIKPSRISI